MNRISELMHTFLGYRCSVCNREYSPTEVAYLCPHDAGVLDVVLDFATIQKATGPQSIRVSSEFSIWRYLPLLPIQDPGYQGTPLRAVGWTPIYQSKVLAGRLKLKNFWIKDESRNPTASFKDRASALVISRAKEIGAQIIVAASTGNAGAALAGMAAATGFSTVIFAPRSAPAAKVIQLIIYGARVLLVDGSYDEAVALSRQVANEYGWYCRNTGYNPFTVEGKKTASFEIWEQILALQQLARPLCIFVSVGDGNIISGLHKGFKDLLTLGWIETPPRLFGVQAEGSSAIANAFDSNSEDIKSVKANTIADSISVDFPSDGLRALRAARQTNGAYIRVADEEILNAVIELGRHGIFAEPAGAAAFAGLRVALNLGLVDDDDPVLVLNTGSGLKDVNAARKAIGQVQVIKPELTAVKGALEVLH